MDKGQPVKTRQNIMITEAIADFSSQPYKQIVHKYAAIDSVRKAASTELRYATDAFKKFINENEVALFYHNKDESTCKYCPQNHVHMLIINPNDGHISQNKTLRTMKSKMLSKDEGYQIKSQKVKSPKAITKYLTGTPRMYLGSNNIKMGLYIAQHKSTGEPNSCTLDECLTDQAEILNEMGGDEANEAMNLFGIDLASMKTTGDSNLFIPDEVDSWTIPDVDVVDEPPPKMRKVQFIPEKEEHTIDLSPTPPLKTNITHVRIETLQKLYTLFNTRNFYAVGRLALEKEDDDSYQKWKDINRCANKAHIISSTAAEATVTENPRAVMDLLVEQNKSSNSVNVMTASDTKELYMEWIAEQFGTGNEARFLLELYLALTMTNPKRCCFLLYGASNAGKTFWITALLANIQFAVGECLKNDEKFRYGGCCGTSVIYADEFTYLNKATVEEFKTLAGGGRLLANKKNMQPELLPPTPFLIASNYKIWDMVVEDMAAIKNRCYIWEVLKESKVLKNYGNMRVQPNPLFFKTAFIFIKDFLEENNYRDDDIWDTENLQFLSDTLEF